MKTSGSPWQGEKEDNTWKSVFPKNLVKDAPRLPSCLSGKEFSCQAGNVGSILRSGRFPREGNDNPLQCACLGNLMDRGAWWTIAHAVEKSQTQLND